MPPVQSVLKNKKIHNQTREEIYNIKMHSYQCMNLLLCDGTFDEKMCSHAGLLLMFVEPGMMFLERKVQCSLCQPACSSDDVVYPFSFCAPILPGLNCSPHSQVEMACYLALSQACLSEHKILFKYANQSHPFVTSLQNNS
jgi:hypothetical protein